MAPFITRLHCVQEDVFRLGSGSLFNVEERPVHKLTFNIYLGSVHFIHGPMVNGPFLSVVGVYTIML
jgi:hypothetical protein